MKVHIEGHTPNLEKLCAKAAKLCYSAGYPDNTAVTPTKAGPLLQKVIDLGHLSVLEHASITFGIEGISRACSHQLVRHRIASFSQQSQRYVPATGKPLVVMPESIEGDSRTQSLFESCMAVAWDTYNMLLKEGVPPEDARFVLPNAAQTSLIMTMNVRELLHFFNLRCCQRAQWEIRTMARQMLALCQTLSPVLFAGAGASCVSGACPEGAMGCKKSTP